MPFDLQQTRYDQLVRRVGGVIGPGAKVAEVLPELFPVIDVERVPGELLVLGATRICTGSENEGPTVGLLSRVQLFNPADSGFLVTISSMTFASTTGENIRWNIETAAIGGLSTNKAFRDGRLTGTTRPVAEVRSDATGAATVRSWQTQIASSRPITLTDENGVAVLAPGTGLTVQGGTNNANLFVSFLWRERVALEAELNF